MLLLLAAAGVFIVIVGLAGVTGASIGNALPEDLAHFISLVHKGAISGKRTLEEQIVGYLMAEEQREPFRSAYEDLRSKLESAERRVLSARRADNLLPVGRAVRGRRMGPRGNGGRMGRVADRLLPKHTPEK